MQSQCGVGVVLMPDTHYSGQQAVFLMKKNAASLHQCSVQLLVVAVAAECGHCKKDSEVRDTAEEE